jgi:hypothetical protein
MRWTSSLNEMFTPGLESGFLPRWFMRSVPQHLDELSGPMNKSSMQWQRAIAAPCVFLGMRDAACSAFERT